MKKIIILGVLTTLLLAIASTAFAGYGRCKFCSCYGYHDRGDLICECGHGYGMHRAN